MYQNFMVRNFRGFREIIVTHCQNINFILGRCGSGKTSLLESIFLHSGLQNPELTFRINGFRGIEILKIELGRFSASPWELLFRNFNLNERIELSARSTAFGRRQAFLQVLRKSEDLERVSEYLFYSGETLAGPPENAHILEVELLEGDNSDRHSRSYMIIDSRGIRSIPPPTPPLMPAIFLNARRPVSAQEEASRFSKLQLTQREGVLIDALQLIDPRIKRLALIVTETAPQLCADIGLSKLLPIAALGDAVPRLTNIVLALYEAQGGMVLVDEIEGGITEKLIPEFWMGLNNALAQYDTQLFASTNVSSISKLSMLCKGAGMKDYNTIELHEFERTLQSAS